MRTFVAAVDTGSFTAAAQRIGISKKLVSKYVAQLEERLGVRLLHRTTRRLSLTDEGTQYYDRCLQFIEDFDELENNLREDRQGVSGMLRLSAPVIYGELHLVPLLADFRKLHPDLSINLQLNDGYVDLAGDGFDLAIRIGVSEPSSMIARQLATTETWVVASPEFIKQFGAPSHPRDLVHFECIHDTNIRSGRNWPFLQDGVIRTVPITGKISVDKLTAAIQMAVGGQGIALCPDYAISNDVVEGRLVRLLADYSSLELDVQLVFLEARYMPARVRAFIDYAVENFTHMTL